MLRDLLLEMSAKDQVLYGALLFLLLLFLLERWDLRRTKRKLRSAEQRERDQRDTTRADSPLAPAADALLVDTSDLTLRQVVDKLAGVIASAVDSAAAR